MPIFATSEVNHSFTPPDFYQLYNFTDGRQALVYGTGASQGVQFYTAAGGFEGSPVFGPGRETIMGPGDTLWSVREDTTFDWANVVKSSSSGVATNFGAVLTNITGELSIGVTPGGNVLVAGVSGTKLIARTISPAGDVGAEFTIFDGANPGPSSSTAVQDIDVVGLSDGTFAVVFSSFSAHHTTVIVNGTTPSAPVDHSGDATISPFQSIAALPGGRYAVVESTIGYNRLNIFEGTNIVESTVLSHFPADGNATDHQVALLADGHLLIVWSEDSPGGDTNRDIKARIIDPANPDDLTGNAFTVNTVTNGDQTIPTITVNSDGSFSVNWRNGTNYSSRTFDPTEFEGTGASDFWAGANFDDSIAGNGGIDLLAGGAGRDTLKGGADNDLMDGGAGTQDIAIYSGAWSEYTITQNPNSSYNISDKVAGRDGLDLVGGIELFSFNGVVGTAAALLLARPNAVDDNNSGDPVGEKGKLKGNSTASGNVLANDTDPNAPFDTRTVFEVRSGSEATTGIALLPVGTVITGKYGTLELNADGSYVYDLNDSDRDTRALKTGQTATDIFTYAMRDGFPHTEFGQLVISIAGSDDKKGNLVRGTAGDDLIDTRNKVGGKGATGNEDTIKGNDGDDSIKGGKGDDIIEGGDGNDLLTGNAGFDQFEFAEHGASNADIITDFDPGEDKIVLDRSVFTKLGDVFEEAEFMLGAPPKGSKVFVAKEADDRILYDRKNGHVFYDADGSGRKKAVLIATLDEKPGTPLDHTDFMIV